jgi:SAM-dependent methyltransferase
MAKTKSPVEKLLADRKGEVLKLDIGCGPNKFDGHIGMDFVKFRGVDIVHDMRVFPWPFPDKTFTLLSSSHTLEHIPRDNGTFIKVMNECWRILKYDGQFRISVPYGGSTMFWADPTHVNGLVVQTFHYFDPLAQLQTYRVYEPAPWKVQDYAFAPEGNMEVLLVKRRDDPSYHDDGKIHYE